MANLSSLMGVQSQMQSIQNMRTQNEGAQMQNQNASIGLQERQRIMPWLSDAKNYTDANGNLDYAKMQQGRALAPSTFAQYESALDAHQQQRTSAQTALGGLDDANRMRNGGFIGGIAKPDNQPPDADTAVKSVQAALGNYPGMERTSKFFEDGVRSAYASKDPQKIEQALTGISRQMLPQQTQQDMNTPNGVNVSDNKTSSVVSTRPGTSVPVGQALPGTTQNLKPGPMQSEEVQADMQGNRYIVQRGARGDILNTRAVPGGSNSSQPGAGPVNLPPNETAQTRDDLQAQRTAASQSVLQAPNMHNLNRQVMAEVDKGITTGSAGSLIQRLRSATGFNIGSDAATDYNTLGKLLERSAATQAQAMGPHTNAGLDSAMRQNGTTDYSPGALRKIAGLNDALTTGATLYQQGLEKAIASSPDGVFSKRKFDQTWGNTFDVNAMRLKNAVDNHDSAEIQAITKEVGGANSKGATELHKKLLAIHQLAGQ